MSSDYVVFTGYLSIFLPWHSFSHWLSIISKAAQEAFLMEVLASMDVHMHQPLAPMGRMSTSGGLGWKGTVSSGMALGI